ncbi:MAG: DUF3048 domain-containing protein [Patescibacteria group bacterium]
MKKKNDNSRLLYSPRTDRQQEWLWFLGIFLAAVFFSWWYGIMLGQSQWKLFDFYLNGTGRSAVVVGQSTDTTDSTADNTVVQPVSSPYRLLDGLNVGADKAHFWPYAVMIENLLTVRPQSGLSQASVVYEALAEGGSTRFMAVFDPSEKIPELMPVRSARPYYLEWASEYGVLYAHAGGSPKALTVIREIPDFHDLDALSSNSKYFWRDTSKAAPHNLVTSSDKMNFALRDKGLLDKLADFSTWIFKDEAALADRGDDGKKVTFNFSSGLTYKVEFVYNQAENVYLRFNAGQPHLDKNTNQQIKVKNVIVQLTPEPELDGGKGRLDIYVGGEGKAWVFRDGQAIEAVWKKATRTDRTRFYDLNGQEIQLDRGNTWIHVISKTQEVTYQ